MTKIKDIIKYLESIAPLHYQEDYDNSGLICGEQNNEVTGVLITLDSTEDVIDEAIEKKCNLIVAHHPIVFRGIKKLTGRNYVERALIRAIKNDIAIYAFHTNLDNIYNGVNKKICDKLGLINTRILAPRSGELSKLVTFIPQDNTLQVLGALHKVGAGNIGNYSNCSFRIKGKGTFVPNEQANPTIGQPNQQEEVIEDRVEVIFPKYLAGKLIETLRTSHPYDEVAYYLHDTNNKSQDVGGGMIGELKNAMTADEFLNFLKKTMDLEVIRHTEKVVDKIKKVAVCGGSGSFLLREAKSKHADVFISADFKYHEFFDAEKDIIIADIGHYESEIFTKDLIYELISEKFSNFALNLSGIKTNPIKYL